MKDDGASLALTLLRLMGWVPPASERRPETDWGEMGCTEACRYAHSVTGLCRYGDLPLRLEPVTARAEEEPEVAAAPGRHPRAWSEVALREYAGASGAEQAILCQLADLTRTRGPWGAALTVFGGAGVARDAAGAGPYATEGREPAAPVPR